MRSSTLSLVLCGACTLARPTLATDDAGIVTSMDDANVADAVSASDSTVAITPFVRVVAVNGAQVIGGPHADFPVLVALTEPWLRSQAAGGDVVRGDGADLYFSSDQGGSQVLSFEIESYSPSTGALVAWVRISALTTTTTFYLHYGDPAITSSRHDVAGTWPGYQLVAHLDGTTSSAAPALTLAFSGTTAEAAKIGVGRRFNGATDDVTVSSTALDDVFLGGGAVEGWIRASTFGTNDFGRIYDKGGLDGWSFSINDATGNDTLAFIHGAGGGSYGTWHAPSLSIPLDTWLHVAAVYDQGTGANEATLYINGDAVIVSKITNPQNPIDSDASFPLVIGNRPTDDRGFDGLLDELRISTASRSSGWYATQYRNHNTPSQFVLVSEPL